MGAGGTTVDLNFMPLEIKPEWSDLKTGERTIWFYGYFRIEDFEEEYELPFRARWQEVPAVKGGKAQGFITERDPLHERKVVRKKAG